ncbi:hypothetical protein [Pyrobaculum sp.]
MGVVVGVWVLMVTGSVCGVEVALGKAGLALSGAYVWRWASKW